MLKKDLVKELKKIVKEMGEKRLYYDDYYPLYSKLISLVKKNGRT